MFILSRSRLRAKIELLTKPYTPPGHYGKISKGDSLMLMRMDNKQLKFHFVTIENLVPEDQTLIKLNCLQTMLQNGAAATTLFPCRN